MEENVTNTDITIDSKYIDEYLNRQSDIKNNLDFVNDKLDKFIENQDKLIDKQNTIIEQQKQLIDYFIPTEEEIKKQQKQEQEQQKKEEEEQEILNQEEEKQEQEQQEFYSNIQTIADNSETETQLQALQDLSTLSQVNIISNGLLIGIICILLLAKFFKR